MREQLKEGLRASGKRAPRVARRWSSERYTSIFAMRQSRIAGLTSGWHSDNVWGASR